MDLRPLMSHDDESNLTILFNIWEISEGWSFYGSMVSIDTYERNSIEFLDQFFHSSVLTMLLFQIYVKNLFQIAIIIMGLLYEALKKINPGHLVCRQVSFGETSSQQNLLNQSGQSYSQESPRGILMFYINIKIIKLSVKFTLRIQSTTCTNPILGMWNPDVFNFFHLFQTILYLLEITLGKHHVLNVYDFIDLSFD